ncbi:uncharacterized protein LOC113991112 [Pipra filicauda]|uniref:Uncharacterized protein LOC113991112 n=1 Tax=Pipra filicauda TaxID=649802 RepID=A0A7R5KN66_9PASS|nr:uncharacterized protein LOC113991112 [Pipra filicauda]
MSTLSALVQSEPPPPHRGLLHSTHLPPSAEAAGGCSSPPRPLPAAPSARRGGTDYTSRHAPRERGGPPPHPSASLYRWFPPIPAASLSAAGFELPPAAGSAAVRGCPATGPCRYLGEPGVGGNEVAPRRPRAIRRDFRASGWLLKGSGAQEPAEATQLPAPPGTSWDWQEEKKTPQVCGPQKRSFQHVTCGHIAWPVSQHLVKGGEIKNRQRITQTTVVFFFPLDNENTSEQSEGAQNGRRRISLPWPQQVKPQPWEALIHQYLVDLSIAGSKGIAVLLREKPRAQEHILK